jgi:PPM family protein phosphatase
MTATLQIVEQAGKTDQGRQRSGNEDSHMVSPPFFAVADGMGGAKAGEVASSIAIEAFSGVDEDEAPPEARLERVARDANRRIYELAHSDESRRGMGTTLTAAMVSGNEVSLGHVGDSRAYRWRDGELEQLTKDHSLVAELERTGQITREAAEHHPQRSIITRALGPEPDVEVDTYTVPGRDGDVFLLCSDGLTGMISDEEVAAIMRGPGSLEERADALVQAANQNGGKDNITVVLFRLGAADGAEEPPADETIAGQVKAADVTKAARAETVARPVPAPSAPAETAEAEATEAVAERPAAVPPRRRLRGGTVLKAGLGVLVVAGVVLGLYAASRQVYFVGTDDAGLVTLYRGLPYELPLGLDLYEEKYTSGVPARAVPRRRRDRVLDHEWRSEDDAVDLVRQLERGRLDTGAGSP